MKAIIKIGLHDYSVMGSRPSPFLSIKIVTTFTWRSTSKCYWLYLLYKGRSLKAARDHFKESLTDVCACSYIATCLLGHALVLLGKLSPPCCFRQYFFITVQTQTMDNK